MVTQFLGAFNDNAFKQLVLLVSLSATLSWVADLGWAAESGQALASALFAIPFVTFGALTGTLADRVSKSRIIVLAKVLEAVVMALALVAFMLRSFPALLGVIFLMGLQSTLFGPSKYGSIPEMVETKDLSRANGLIQMTTFLAIIFGAAIGGQLLESFEARLWIPALIFLVIAGIGTGTSLGIRALPAADPARRLTWNVFTEIRSHWRVAAADKTLTLCLFASGFFFLVGGTLLLVVNQYGTWLGLGGGDIGLLLALLSLGIAIGSILAVKISGDRIEGGLVPLGLLGIALSLLLVRFDPSSLVLLRCTLVGAGICAGLFTVPIRALIQHRPPAAERGAVLGLSEVMDFTGVLASSAVFYLLHGVLHLEPASMLTVVSIGTLVFLAGTLLFTAEFAIRLALMGLVLGLYRIRTTGRENVPEEGGALVVCNHLSFIDGFLVSAACPRPMRFLMFAPYFRLPIIGALARLMGTVPVSAEDSREAKDASIAAAAEAAASGELVCIFAEGAITRSGALLPFATGLERIATRGDVPIIPVALDRVWGSIFSFDRGRAFFKWPQRFPHPVDVSFGKPLPPATPAWEVRNRIAELMSEGRATRRSHRGTLAYRVLRNARWLRGHGRRPALGGTEGQVTHRRLLLDALALGASMHRRLAPGSTVGLALPKGFGAVRARFACVLEGLVAEPLDPDLSFDELRALALERGLAAVIHAGPAEQAGASPLLSIASLTGGIRPLDRLRARLILLCPASWGLRLTRATRDPLAPAEVHRTRGRTGPPKRVALSHGGLLANAQALQQMFDLGSEDRLLSLLPFHYAFGSTVTLWTPLLAGAAILFPPEDDLAPDGKTGESSGDGATLVDLLRAYPATVLVGTPRDAELSLTTLSPEDLPALRLALVGGAALAPELRERWRARFHNDLLEGYGCTECSPVIAVNVPPPPQPVERQPGTLPGSLGLVLPGTAVRVVDPTTGASLPPGEEGLLEVKGPQVMIGYLRAASATEGESSGLNADGWFATGDRCTLGKDGFLRMGEARVPAE
jgi:acyl-[acyl-carrier-protein]-phospholipid O-acyltransferase/long-chain-fatty-acid--[acyl-carrier-protein] ligase